MQLSRSSRRRVYLVAPRTPESFWSMQATVDAVGARSLMPNAALATLAALTPPDAGVDYVYCDENVAPLDLRMDCDLVALTGYTLHARRLEEISRAFRQRGVPVALGGALATLEPERAHPLADHLFVGEGELTWPRFLRDWRAGRAAARYEQTEPVDLACSPPPDWSHIRGRDYLYLPVQAGRGCPNRCDFCDAVRLVGRRHRAKPLEQVLVEVENARRAGAETIFFSEDNFFVSRPHTRALLERLVRWNTALEHPVQFACQASVRIADDDQVMRLLADARFAVVFLGVESVREACLREVSKGHLHRADLAARLRRLSSFGILPFLGLMVGFDHDDAATFDEIERFLDESASPMASLSVLNAPEHTPLHARLAAAGRIAEDFGGTWELATNIVPRQWPLEELLARHRRTFRRIYEPERFETRAVSWLRNVSYFSPLYRHRRRRPSNVVKLYRIGRYYALEAPPPVRRLFFRLLAAAWRLDPRLIRKAITIMTQYCHYYAFANRPS